MSRMSVSKMLLLGVRSFRFRNIAISPVPQQGPLCPDSRPKVFANQDGSSVRGAAVRTCSDLFWYGTPSVQLTSPERWRGLARLNSNA